MNCKLVGRWRIVEADIWDRPSLDLCGPALIIIRANGRGAPQAGLDVEYSRASVGFTLQESLGSDASCIAQMKMSASRPAKRPWTSGEENKLRDMLADGKTADEIAVGLNRTRTAVYARLQRL